jgi:transposase
MFDPARLVFLDETAARTKMVKHLKQSRNDLFASLDRPTLKGLPSERYQYAEWKRCTVAPDYHVEVDDHYYSVPFGLLRETVEARFTDGTIEVFHKGERIAERLLVASASVGFAIIRVRPGHVEPHPAQQGVWLPLLGNQGADQSRVLLRCIRGPRQRLLCLHFGGAGSFRTFGGLWH